MAIFSNFARSCCISASFCGSFLSGAFSKIPGDLDLFLAETCAGAWFPLLRICTVGVSARYLPLSAVTFAAAVWKLNSLAFVTILIFVGLGDALCSSGFSQMVSCGGLISVFPRFSLYPSSFGVLTWSRNPFNSESIILDCDILPESIFEKCQDSCIIL